MLRFPARAIAAFVFAAALFAGRVAIAGTVTDCGDLQDATSTLRGVVASAVDNDLIDVSQCSTITLQQGAISTALNLTIEGASNELTTIDAGTNGRAFVDTGVSSSLTLKYLAIERGRAPGLDPNGGCVLAKYQVYVQNSTLNDCHATSNDEIAHGGAVNAFNVILTSSVITDSLASSANADAQGGAVYASNTVSCTDSVVQNNSVLSGIVPIEPFGKGGGIYSSGMSVTRCAIIGNHASHTGGGIFGNSVFVFVGNSTVSGNSADYGVGGMEASPSASVSNSTIAFNQGGSCGGLFATSGGSIYSTIIANNTASTATVCHDVSAGFSAGTNNIVGVADDGVTLPGDTYVGDPKLTPLGNHGGPTPTHALLATSYAIDHGNDVSGFETDQRGSGYAREVNGVADIGAYERQVVDDEIFYNGME